MKEKDLQKLMKLKAQADELEQKAKIKAAMDFQRDRIRESKQVINKGSFFSSFFGGNKKNNNGVKLSLDDGFDLKDYIKPPSKPKPLLASEAFGDNKKKSGDINKSNKKKAKKVVDDSNDFFDDLDKTMNNDMGGLL